MTGGLTTGASDEGSGLLISFSNQMCSPRALLALTDDEGTVRRWVTVPDDRDFGGANGIARIGDYIAVTLPGTAPALAVYDCDLELACVWPFRHAADPHGICADGSSLFVASTGNDRIVRLELELGSGQVLGEEDHWSHPRSRSTSEDSMHVNGVTIIDSRLLATCFGPRSSEGWLGARSGELIDVATGETLLADLQHPHSAISLNGTVFVVESGAGALRSLDGETVDVGGYLRGAVVDRDRVLVGRSSARLHSRSLGTLNVVPTSPESQLCGVVELDLHSLRTRGWLSLRDYGAEIYEILPVVWAGSGERVSQPDTVEPRLWRQMEMERVMTEAQQRAASLEAYARSLEVAGESLQRYAVEACAAKDAHIAELDHRLHECLRHPWVQTGRAVAGRLRSNRAVRGLARRLRRDPRGSASED